MPSGAAGTQGRRATGATSGDPSPARPLVVQDATATGLIPLVLDEGDSLPQQRGARSAGPGGCAPRCDAL
jgi:hypothetical protein